MRVGSIQRLIYLLSEAFSQLETRVNLQTVESLAIIVYKAMTVQVRNFHNLDHAFRFAEQGNPLQILAALFHDLVYYQVDAGFSPEIRAVIAPYIQEQEREIYIIEQAPPGDRLFQIALDLFDLQCGSKLSLATGLNEFLSAMVMNKKLEGILSEQHLVKMTLCVEATIPFRGTTEGGENHFDVLERRLCKVCTENAIWFTESEMHAAIQLAMNFANRDVINFAEPDVSKFLENTWKLFNETNIGLRSREVYSIQEYRQYLQKMEALLTSLDPNNVFHRYRGIPTEEEYWRMVEMANQNIETTRQYVRIKLLAQAILEALAEATGGDAPLSLFMGDLPNDNEETQRLEDYLPDIEIAAWVDPSATIFKLFTSGVGADPNFDIKTSPLSFFLFKSLSTEQINRALELAKEMFIGSLSADNFLNQMDQAVVGEIARASAMMVNTRRDKLLKYYYKKQDNR
jgi:hypothetical protein